MALSAGIYEWFLFTAAGLVIVPFGFFIVLAATRAVRAVPSPVLPRLLLLSFSAVEAVLAGRHALHGDYGPRFWTYAITAAFVLAVALTPWGQAKGTRHGDRP